jgi:hypothetical protein
VDGDDRQTAPEVGDPVELSCGFMGYHGVGKCRDCGTQTITGIIEVEEAVDAAGDPPPPARRQMRVDPPQGHTGFERLACPDDATLGCSDLGNASIGMHGHHHQSWV